MTLLVGLPVVLPLVLGALSLAIWRFPVAQRVVALAGTAMLLLLGIALLWAVIEHGPMATALGEWRAPFGIVLVADLLSAIMVLMAGIMGFVVALYSLGTVSRGHENFGYFPLLHLLLAGVCGSFLTGDIFNLYVWFEVMLLSSFALLVLGGERAQMEGAIKYVTINLFSSAMLLTAVGLTYGLVGTLNMADIAVKFDGAEDGGRVTVIAMLFMVAFGIKAAAFPLFFWLPASYHTPPVAVSALFAALLTKVGVYAMFRMFTLVFDADTAYTHNILLWIAGFTMVTGVLGAAAQFEFRRILSFHIVSQIGYMLMGLALFTPLALAGGLYAIFHNIIVKTNLFLVSGVAYRLQGTYQLKQLGGLYRSHPGLGVLFLLSALSMAGIPPLSGFFAKFILVRAGLEIEAWVIVAVALAVGIGTLFSMIKIWAEVFWKARPEEATTGAPVMDVASPGLHWLYVPIVLLAGLTVLIGVAGQPIFEVSMQAAEQLLDNSAYIEAVLGSEEGS